MRTKICSKCGEEKDISQYGVNTKRKDGSIRYRAACKVCYNKQQQQYKTKNKKAIKDRSKNWKCNTKEHKLNYELSKNKKTNIKYIQCCDCGNIEVTRQRVKRNDRCLKCHSKYKHNTKYYPIRRAKNHDLKRNCIKCNKEFETWNNQGYCSVECRKAAKNEHLRQRNKYHRRAKLYGCYYEPFSRKAIFKRDKWKCQSCGVKVQKKDCLADNAAELDHIIPLSKGGPHTPSNCQTLCRKCNSTKSNKIEEGTQITLYASI